MRRIHLFEIEDFSWFPAPLRNCATRMLLVVHRLIKTADDLAPLLERALRESGQRQIVDLCSGSGGPMVQVVTRLQADPQWHDLKLELTDLYPGNLPDQHQRPFVRYRPDPVDAANVPSDCHGLRTMICSFHHMRPSTARSILASAQQTRQPILIFEISDNSAPPPYLFWVVLPVNFVFALVVSLMVRPLSWRQLVFTWLIPILPVCFAWDGAVSNARTYGPSDLDELLAGLESSDYRWEYDTIPSKPSAKLYLLGMPV